MEEELFGGFIFVAGGLVMLLFGAIFAEFAWDSIDLARSRPRWDSTPGQIITSIVEEQPDLDSWDSRAKEYSANIRYEYQVDGVALIGSKLELVSGNFSWVRNRTTAARLADQHPAGAPVTVYYDSAAPDLSALSLSCSTSTMVALAFAAVFNAGIGLFMVGFGMSRVI